ncbi:glycosyltransferase [Nonomuraea sp. B12E4]|uniref:glycosyltransferase n=1 Tax=Nonomuraea sp. B12E4 TaxID=3153564 RepID=UPI00325DFF19
MTAEMESPEAGMPEAGTPRAGQAAPAGGVKVAVFPIDAIGHVNPLLPVVAALATRPEVAEVRSFGAAALTETFTAAGARHVPIDTPPAGPVPASMSELAFKSFVRPLAIIEEMTARAAAFRPDVVLYDVFCVHGLVAARALGLPSASLVTFPGYGVLGEHFAVQHGGPHAELGRANQRYRELYGLDLLGEGFLPVLFPSGDLSIVTAVESLSRRVDAVMMPRLRACLSRFEATCEFVGPSVGAVRFTPEPVAAPGRRSDGGVPGAASAGSGAHDRFAAEFPYALLDRARRDGRSIVLFSLGTVLTDFRFDSPVGGAPTGRAYLMALLDRLTAALGDREDLLVVAATGSVLAAADEPKWPDNFVVRAFLPQRELLEGHAGAFITHHGTGSTAESILAGVPMVSVPGAGDQIPNAEIAISAGAAVALWDPHDVFATMDAGLLERAVRQALRDPSHREACLALRRRMAAAGGAERAARLVAELAGRS